MIKAQKALISFPYYFVVVLDIDQFIKPGYFKMKLAGP